MATKKSNTQTEQQVEVANLANTKENATKFKSWENKNNFERLESINSYNRMIIATNIKQARQNGNEPFYRKSMEIKDIDATMPFNPSNGKPFGGELSMVMRADAQTRGYESAEYITMKQANFLGGKLRQEQDEKGKLLFNENGTKKYPNGVKSAYMAEFEYKPKTNENGEIIQAKDKDGKPKFDNKGNIVPVMEKIALKEPKLETVTYYHISSFDNIDNAKLQKRNMNVVNEYRKELQGQQNDYRSNLSHLGLAPKTQKDLENFLDSQTKGKDYQAIQHTNIREVQNELSQSQGRSF